MAIEQRQKEQGERLAAQRKSKGYSQVEFAELCQVSRRTQINYEQGKRKPDSDYWVLAMEAGIDVSFVLDGVVTIHGTVDLQAKEITTKKLISDPALLELVCLINGVLTKANVDCSDVSAFKRVLPVCEELENQTPYSERTAEEKQQFEQLVIATVKAF